ncbi:hypothetical protein [Pseudaestuariivita atlantica]|nr:hypothetical protein [Pseudaestuariivita atlantica]
MFRLFRLVLFVTLAFVAGIVWERAQESERCAARAGIMEDGLCLQPR